MPDTTVPYTVTAPSGSDGYGEIAVFNDTTSGNFVGYLVELSGFGGPTVRTSTDDIVQGHGAQFGDFFHGYRPFTMRVEVAKAATTGLSNARYTKLCRAVNAMENDGTIVWTESGGVAKRILFRREQPPSDPDNDTSIVLLGLASADPYFRANTESSASPGAGLTNAGDAGALPRFTFTSGASGTVVLSRTSPSPTQTLTLTIGGTTGLAASTATTVDFLAGTVVQGSTDKYSAIVFPPPQDKCFWEMAPGANTITVTGATSSTVLWRSAWTT